MRIVTDSASDILKSEALEMKIDVVPIKASFENTTFTENTPEEFERFYTELGACEALPISSQPSPDCFVNIYNEAKANNEEVLVITISSELSGTYNGACLAIQLSGYDKVHVIDSRQATLSERMLVEYAVKLRDQGLPMKDIIHKLNFMKEKIHLTGVPADMIYLKKGGRVSPMIASIGDVLGIKPILVLQDGVIECVAKTRGCKNAKLAMQKLMENFRPDPDMPVFFGSSNNPEKASDFLEETSQKFELTNTGLQSVGPAIGTHIGPDALLLCWVEQ